MGRFVATRSFKDLGHWNPALTRDEFARAFIGFAGGSTAKEQESQDGDNHKTIHGLSSVMGIVISARLRQIHPTGMAEEFPSLKGQLLLDSGQLRGSFFHRSVVLICHHDKEGAFGLVLNQPTENTVG